MAFCFSVLVPRLPSKSGSFFHKALGREEEEEGLQNTETHVKSTS